MIWILSDDEEQGLIAFQAKPSFGMIRDHLTKGFLRNYELTDVEISTLLDEGEVAGESGDFLCLFAVNEHAVS